MGGANALGTWKETLNMKIVKRFALVIVASAFVVGGLAACEKSNETKAKDAVDDAAKNAKDAIDNAAK